MKRIATMVGLLCVLLSAGEVRAEEVDAALTKIAVLDIRAKGTVDEAQVEGLSSLLASEVTALGRFTVITSSDMKEMLGFEAQQQLMGCTEGTSCLAEIGGALGVDRLLSTEVSQVGSTWLLTLVLLDIGEAKAAARLTRKTTEEGLVDASTAMVREILAPTGGAPGGETAVGPADETTDGVPDTRPPPPPLDPGGLHLDVDLGTQFPRDIGLGVQLTLPAGFRVRLGLGLILEAYGAGIAKFYLGGEDGLERRRIVRAMLKNHGLFQIAVGWRPLKSLGLEVMAGWAFIVGGYHKVTAGELARAHTNIDTALPAILEDREVEVNGRGHAVNVEVAWRFDLGQLFLRPAVGFFGVVASNPDLDSNLGALGVAWDEGAWDNAIEDNMDEDLDRAKTVHLGLSVGYRIF